MAVYKLFPSKDTSLYSFYPSMNTGIDAIIEAGNLNVNINPVPQVFRFIVQFDQNEINDVIDNKVGGTNFSSSLRTYIAQAQGITMNTFLEIYPISGSWNNGSGTYLDSPFTTNGASWNFRNFSGSTSEGAALWQLDSFPTYVTASYSGSYVGGGTWYTGSDDINNPNIEVTQSFEYRTEKDLNAPVTDIVKVWYSSSKNIGSFTNIENNGFVVKWEDAIEFSPSNALQPILQFYSVDTNTIYPPNLEIKWDDSSFETGSLPGVTNTDLFMSLDNNPGVFYSSSINTFRLNVRPEFPVRTYQTSSFLTNNHYLPTSSYYAIKDLDTNEYVIDFDDEFTKISCDENGNFFKVYMNGLEPERYYEILIKTIISGSTLIQADRYNFKIVNG